MPRMSLLLALSLAVAGCSAPYDSDKCRFGSVAASTGACVMPTHSAQIDGNFDEWADVEILDGDSPALLGTQVALDGDALVFRLLTKDPPPSGKTALFVVSVEGVGRVVDIYVGRGVRGSYWAGPNVKEEIRLGDAPGTVAFGDSGVEMRVPISMFPFPGQARFAFGLLHLDSKGYFVDSDLGYARPVCWDPRQTDNACAL